MSDIDYVPAYVPGEILTDIIDNETGEVYKEDMLHAYAYLWCTKFGWKVIAEHVEQPGEWYPCFEPHRAIRSIYVEPTPNGGRWATRGGCADNDPFDKVTT